MTDRPDHAIVWPRITAVAFDCDGVLVDSGASVERCWHAWAAAYGLDGAAVLPEAHGRPSRDTAAAWLPPELVEEAVDAIDRIELEDAGTVGAIPGAPALLAALPAGRWGIVTSASRPLAVARLAAAGLPAPRVLVTADDVARGKPHPEGYELAASLLGVDVGDMAVIEDTASGIRAAREAHAGVVIRVGVGPLCAGEDGVVPDLRHVAWTGTLGVRAVHWRDTGPVTR